MRPPIFVLAFFVVSMPAIGGPLMAQEARPRRAPSCPPGRVEVRGIYGGVPTRFWTGASPGRLRRQRRLDGPAADDEPSPPEGPGPKVFAEFNTMHDAAYLKDHPDAAPVGTDGKVCPPPDGWQGVCPTHPGYREARMAAFRKALTDFEIDGIWLDYHHSHASWEQAVPNLPDTCFCARCLPRFQEETGVELPDRPTPECRPAARAHRRSGSSGAAACSPTGSASSGDSRRRGPGRCWGRSTARGAEEDFGGALRESWRST